MTRYLFQNWQDGDTNLEKTISLAAGDPAQTLTLYYAPGILLNVSPGPNGSVTPSGQVALVNGTAYDFNATADPGYEVDRWELDGVKVGTGNTYTLTAAASMDGQSLVAVFAAATHTLTVQAASNGTTSPPPGTYPEPAGSTQNVTATPDPGFFVQNWIVDGSSTGITTPTIPVTMDADHTVQPVFAQITYTLTVVPTANGTSNPPPGTYPENASSTVNVQAVPNTGYRVGDWLLDGASTGITTLGYPVTMDKNHTLQPVFQAIPPPPPDQGTISVHAVLSKLEIIVSVTITDKATGALVWSGNTPALDIAVNVGVYTVQATSDTTPKSQDVTVTKESTNVVTFDYTPTAPLVIDVPTIGGIVLALTDAGLVAYSLAHAAGLI